MTWKPRSWLWIWTMYKNDQIEVVMLRSIMGCYHCLAQVWFEVANEIVHLQYERLKFEVCKYEILSKGYTMNIMYLLYAFNMTYIDLWSYDTYDWDCATTIWLSLMFMSYVDWPILDDLMIFVSFHTGTYRTN